MTDRYKFTLIIERITWVVVHPLCMPPMHSGHLINSHNIKPEKQHHEVQRLKNRSTLENNIMIGFAVWNQDAII